MRPIGDTAVLLDADDTDDPQGLARALRSFVTDAIPAADTLGVIGPLPDPLPEPIPGSGGRMHEIPVCFDGEDVDVLPGAGERVWELDVVFLGFRPGFAYLRGMPTLPRRSAPRTRVPPGSFAVAGGYAGIYPSASPGGWNLLGRTNVRLFDPTSPPYALLTPGDRVRIVPVVELPPGPLDPPHPAPHHGSGLLIDEPAPLTLVEDGGRLGLGSIGVPRSGAANEFARRAGNLALGNPADSAAIELIGTSRFTAQKNLLVILVSGDGSAALAADDTPLAANHVHQIGTGQTLMVRAPRRALLAVGGGIASPLVLGSRSTDRNLPTGPVTAGTVLPVGAPAARARQRIELPPWETVTRLRAIAGPDAVPAAALDALTHCRFVVGPDSDRTGIRLALAGASTGVGSTAGRLAAGASTGVGSTAGRLAGGQAAADRTAGLLGVPDLAESHAVVPGAIQITPSGQSVILGPDCGPIGGYAVAATVISADLWRLGDLAPGDELEVSLVTLAYAATARARLEAAIAGSVRGWFPTRVG